MSLLAAAGPVETLAEILPSVLAVGFLLAFIRLVRGPSLPDRVIALDLMANIVAGMIAIHAIATDHSEFLRGATVLALISFLGTVAFSRYVEKKAAST